MCPNYFSLSGAGHGGSWVVLIGTLTQRDGGHQIYPSGAMFQITIFRPMDDCRFLWHHRGRVKDKSRFIGLGNTSVKGTVYFLALLLCHSMLLRHNDNL